jgi:hypothetical protein
LIFDDQILIAADPDLTALYVRCGNHIKNLLQTSILAELT